MSDSAARKQNSLASMESGDHQNDNSPVNTGRKQADTQFKQGQSGNPKGRPKGSRNKLSEDFIAALQADFQEHGASVIERVRAEKPEAYLRLIASIVPKDITVSANPYDGITDEDLEAMIKVLHEHIADVIDDDEDEHGYQMVN